MPAIEKQSDLELDAMRDLLAAENLIDFCIALNRAYDPQWFHKEIAKALEKIERREIKRLIIEVPPRFGKSELATVNFPAWYLGRHPSHEIITASYSSELAEKFGSKCRDVMNHDQYQAIFPEVRLRQDTKAKAFWRTLQGGSYMATGIGGSATGSGANILLIDDPVRNAEDADSETYRERNWDWYTSVARTRLEKEGAIIVIMTRWHQDDLVGRILEREVEGGEKWHRITFPAVAEVNDRFRDVGDALWPEKYDRKALDAIRADIGERAWFSLFQQNPIPAETQVFKPEWMTKEFDPEQIKDKTMNRYATIDTADTDKEGADYIGVSVVDWDLDNNWNMQWIKRYRLNILGLVDLIFNIWQVWKPLKIGVEKKSFLYQLKPLLDERSEETGIFPVVVELEHGGKQKEARIIGALQGRMERGKILFKKDAKDDTAAFKRELLDFPKGKNDDCIDSAAYIDQIGQRPFSPPVQKPRTLQDDIDEFKKHNKNNRARRI
jgi:hypothetical protein